MNILEQKLTQLVTTGSLKSFLLEELDETGKVGRSRFCNSERLTLVFPNNDRLVLSTVCSGSAENVTLTTD